MKSGIPQPSCTGIIWIAGGARSGLAAARLLKERGFDVFLSDAGPLSQAARTSLSKMGIPFEENGHDQPRFLAEAAALVVSPAIVLGAGLALAARKAGIPVFGEIEVGAWFLQGHETIIAITGTNGKSTTTAYTAQALERGGCVAVACGNIGLPFCEAILAGYDHFALELSSYQLETTLSLQADVGVILNLQKDHLLRYGTMPEYLKAKWRLLHLVKDSGLCLVDEPVLEEALALGFTLPRAKIIVLRPFAAPDGKGGRASGRAATGGGQALWKLGLERARTLPVSRYQGLLDLPASTSLGSPLGSAWVEKTKQGGLKAVWHSASGGSLRELTVREPVLPGAHNATNVLAATIACASIGVATTELAAQWERQTSRYLHLPHRLEFVLRETSAVRDAHGITKRVVVVNDSKATNVESTITALRSFERDTQGRGGVRLLVGGEPKGESFLPLAHYFGEPVVGFYPFGKAAPLVASDLCALAERAPGSVKSPSGTLEEAAEQALSDAAQGEVVLLSPACASFDAFRNFEHRGEAFKQWARNKLEG